MPQIPGVPDHAADVERPEPVVDAAKVAASVALVVGGVLTVLAAFGVTVPDPDELTRAVVSVATGALTLVSVASTLWAAFRARAKVTPLESPRNSDGTPLMAVPGLSQGPAV